MIGFTVRGTVLSISGGILVSESDEPTGPLVWTGLRYYRLWFAGRGMGVKESNE